MLKTRRLMVGGIRVVLLLACVASYGCAAPNDTVADAERPTPVVLAPAPQRAEGPFHDYVPGIRNFGFVSTDVWRGGKPSKAGLKHLAAMGVKTVIDLQMDDESADVPEGVKYVPIRVTLWAAEKLDVPAVLKALKESPKPVYIHCLQGRDRCGLAVAAYRLENGMSADEAIRELEQFGVNFVYNGTLKRRIRELERQKLAGGNGADIAHVSTDPR
jgi:protein tyrosine phosphatase (PTP) superfamily phosphohydrolase (DUF442 family)